MDTEKIQMKALDSFYADDVKQVSGGSQFEVATEARAKTLEDRGLAVRVDAETGASAKPAKAAKRRK